MARENDHAVTFMVTVKGFGYAEQVHSETENRLKKILDQAFGPDHYTISFVSIKGAPEPVRKVER